MVWIATEEASEFNIFPKIVGDDLIFSVGICFLVISNIVMYFTLENLIDKGWRIKN